jgi:hypothetical protein
VVESHIGQQQIVLRLASVHTSLIPGGPALYITLMIVLLCLAAGIAIHYALEHHMLPDNPLFHLGEPHLATAGGGTVGGASMVKPASDDTPPPSAVGEETASHPVPGQLIMPAAVEAEEEPEPTPFNEPKPFSLDSITAVPSTPVPALSPESTPTHPAPGHIVMPAEPETEPEPEVKPEPALEATPGSVSRPVSVSAHELHAPTTTPPSTPPKRLPDAPHLPPSIDSK